MYTKWIIFAWSDYELLYSIESIHMKEVNTLKEAIAYAKKEWVDIAENVDIVRKRDFKTIVRYKNGETYEEE